MAPIWPRISILMPTFMNGHRNSPLKLYAITKYPWKCFWGSLGAKICEFENDVNLSTLTALNIKFRVICNIFVLQCTNAYIFMKNESIHDKQSLEAWRN